MVGATVKFEVALVGMWFAVGLVLSAYVAVLAARRFLISSVVFDSIACDGFDFVLGSAGDSDQRFLPTASSSPCLHFVSGPPWGLGLGRRGRGSLWLWPWDLSWHGNVSGLGLTAH